MIRYSYLLLFLLLSALPAGARALSADEDPYEDSIRAAMNRSASDSIKARLALELAGHWNGVDSVKARHYLEEGKKLAGNHPFLNALYYWREGSFHYTIDPDLAQACLQKADSLLKIYKTKEAYRIRSKVWSEYANVYLKSEDDISYVNIIVNKAIPLALQARDSIMLGLHYKGLGVVFMNTGQYDKAEAYLKQSADMLTKAGASDRQMIFVYNWLSETYVYLNRLPEARSILDALLSKLLKTNQPTLYLGYYKVMGLYHHHKQQYDNAINSFDLGLSFIPAEDQISRREFTFLKIKTLLAAARYKQAQQLLSAFSAEQGIMDQPGARMPIYEATAELYAGLKEPYLAYEYQKRYSRLLDSVYRSRLLIDVNALEIRYKHAENQKEIATLKARNEQIATRDRNSRLLSWLMALASMLLLIIALLSLLYYRNNKRLMRQKELNYRHQLKEIAQQQRLQFGQAVLQGEEQERRRVARDLHDGLGGILAGVKINLSGQIEEMPVRQRTELVRIIGQLDHSVTELRRIAHNMMPVNLLKFGLRTALKDLCESLMSDMTRIDFLALGIENNLNEEAQIHIYRIVQELLSNAIRHAEARHIILQCSQDSSTFLITHEDDGKGFDPSVAASGIGLSNIRNRVGFLNGHMEIDSAINEGTIINIELYVGT